MTSETLRPPPESTARAKGETSWTPSGKCLNFVWWCIDGITSAGYPDANTALADVNTLHAGDRDPPPGVPCYWTGSTYGHVALSLGGGNVRSTDYPSKGQVSTVSIDKLTSAWGRKYEGWAEDYNDTPIPGVEGVDDMPSADEVADEVWTRPVKNSAGATKSTGDAQGSTFRNTESIAATVNGLRTATADEVWTRPVENYAGSRVSTGSALGVILRNNEELAEALRAVQSDVDSLATTQAHTIERMAEAIEWLAGHRGHRDDASDGHDHDHDHGWPHRRREEDSRDE